MAGDLQLEVQEHDELVGVGRCMTLRLRVLQHEETSAETLGRHRKDLLHLELQRRHNLCAKETCDGVPVHHGGATLSGRGHLSPPLDCALDQHRRPPQAQSAPHPVPPCRKPG